MDDLKRQFKLALKTKEIPRLVSIWQELRILKSGDNEYNLALDQLWRSFVYPIISLYRSGATTFPAENPQSKGEEFTAFLLECSGYFRQRLEEQHVVAEERYLILLYLGDLSRYLKNYQSSIGFYQQAILLLPHKGQSYNQLAVVYQLLKQNQLAFLFYLRSFLTSDPFLIGKENFLKFGSFDTLHKSIATIVADGHLKEQETSILESVTRSPLHCSTLIALMLISVRYVNVGLVLKRVIQSQIDALSGKALSTLSSAELQLIKLILLFIVCNWKGDSVQLEDTFIYTCMRSLSELRGSLGQLSIPDSRASIVIKLSTLDTFSVKDLDCFNSHGNFLLVFEDNVTIKDSLGYLFHYLDVISGALPMDTSYGPTSSSLSPSGLYLLEQAYKDAIIQQEKMMELDSDDVDSSPKPKHPDAQFHQPKGRLDHQLIEEQESDDDVVVFTGRQGSIQTKPPQQTAQHLTTKASPVPIGHERSRAENATSPFIRYYSDTCADSFPDHAAASAMQFPKVGHSQNARGTMMHRITDNGVDYSTRSLYSTPHPGVSQSTTSFSDISPNNVGNRISFLPSIHPPGLSPHNNNINTGFSSILQPFSWLTGDDSKLDETMPFKLT